MGYREQRAWLAVALSLGEGEIAHGDDQGRQENVHEQSQPPVQQEQHDHDGADHEQVQQDSDHALGHDLLQGGDVVGQAGDQAPHRVAVEEGDGHALQVAEKLYAQVHHDPLAHIVHQHALSVPHEQDAGEATQEQHHQEPQAVGAALSDLVVDGGLEDQGPDDLQRGDAHEQ